MGKSYEYIVRCNGEPSDEAIYRACRILLLSPSHEDAAPPTGEGENRVGRTVLAPRPSSITRKVVDGRVVEHVNGIRI